MTWKSASGADIFSQHRRLNFCRTCSFTKHADCRKGTLIGAGCTIRGRDRSQENCAASPDIA
jgi:hypothetical protein